MVSTAQAITGRLRMGQTKITTGRLETPTRGQGRLGQGDHAVLGEKLERFDVHLFGRLPSFFRGTLELEVAKTSAVIDRFGRLVR